MIKNHDAQYKELFSNPTLVSELLRSFVDEKFVQELDFSTLKKLNTHFITGKFRKRESDIIYQISYHGRPVYIYLLLEFQSTVDKFMSLRLLEYIVQFYKDLLKVEKLDRLPPVFPIVLYSGDDKWTAPIRFKDLLVPSKVPAQYIPDFQYYKIAINEIPQKRLIEIKNAVASIFYVEKSNPQELAANIKTFVELIKAEKSDVIDLIADWFFMSQDYTIVKKHISSINELTEVTTMWATAVKEHDSKVRMLDKQETLQETLIELVTIKFGLSAKAKRHIASTCDISKLEKALKKFALATTQIEVLKCLD